MGLFNLFRKKNMGEKIQEYLGNQAIILDVRTIAEWNEGHSEGAKHIVLNFIPEQVEQIKAWGKPVIAVCRSGARSGQATDFLVAQGIDVINGGPWENVDQYLTK
ncbi:Sulfurtransferase [Tenacibaculum dicentrarchi]|nr:Sulfurtransferase [Tenacibaculum dicentrarchi]